MIIKNKRRDTKAQRNNYKQNKEVRRSYAFGKS